MSDWKDRLFYPPLYLIFLLAAIYFVYRAFTFGLEHGEYAGKYDPETEGGPPMVQEETFNLAELLEPGDELIGQGQKLYNINCSSCHGPGGMGDGPKSAGLNPPPRKFPGEQFKQGAGTLQIYQTLNTGVPGSSMASFSFMNPRELVALAHYVRTFITNPPSDPPALVQQLAPGSAAGATPSTAAGDSASGDSTTNESLQPAAAPSGPALPVDFAIERMTETRRMQVKPLLSVPSVYTDLCSACHGKRGEGAVVSREFPSVGTVYARTKALSSAPRRILADNETFATFMAAGIPSQPGHRFTVLSAKQVKELLETIQQAAGN